MTRISITILVIAFATAAQAERRTLPVSCDVVRSLVPAARTLSAKQQREMAREYHVTRSMIRQARECLR
jgi:hypothetical protein